MDVMVATKESGIFTLHPTYETVLLRLMSWSIVRYIHAGSHEM